MPTSRGNYSLLLSLFAACLVLAFGQPQPVLADEGATASWVEPDPFQPLRAAWQQGRDAGKPVMLVLGAEWCDRCALLERYMADDGLRHRIDDQFVVLSLDVGSPDSMISLADGEQRLPVIVLLDSAMEFDGLMSSDSLMTFLPEPYEPLYDWVENILFYTEQSLALR